MESLPLNHVSFYDVLQVDPSCTTLELKTAYHKLLLASHPDKTKSNIVDSKTDVNIPQIQEAYRILTSNRKMYDTLLKEHHVITGLADGSGLDHLDLSTFKEQFKDGEYIWVNECIRCTVGNHIIKESQLENVPIVNCVGEVAVQCNNCSLWVSVGFKQN